MNAIKVPWFWLSVLSYIRLASIFILSFMPFFSTYVRRQMNKVRGVWILAIISTFVNDTSLNWPHEQILIKKERVPDGTLKQGCHIQPKIKRIYFAMSSLKKGGIVPHVLFFSNSFKNAEWQPWIDNRRLSIEINTFQFLLLLPLNEFS